MVEVRIVSSGQTISIEAEGHALFDKKGKDIVCASVSVLLQNWYLSSRNLTDADIDLEQTSGFFKAFQRNITEEQFLLFRSLMIGLRTLLEYYPKNIKVTWEDSNGRS